nr:hypothetical protein [Actinoplanes aureus]
MTDDEVARLRRELERLRAENNRLSRLLDLRGQHTAPAQEQLAAMATPGPVTMASPVREKLAFYANLFQARRDAYAKRWENNRLGTAGWSPAVAGGWRKAMDRRTAAYLPLTAEVVAAMWSATCFWACIRCSPTTPASSWPRTSMAALRCSMRWLTAKPPEPAVPGGFGNLPVGTRGARMGVHHRPDSRCYGPVDRNGPVA